MSVTYNISAGNGTSSNNICIQMRQITPSSGKYLYVDDLSGTYISNGSNSYPVSDASAENNCSNAVWHTYWGPSTECATNAAHSGSRSWKITTTGNQNEGMINGQDGKTYKPGQTLKICQWIIGYPGQSWYVSGRTGSPYNEGMSGYYINTPGSGQWQQYCVYYTVQQNVTSAYIQVWQNGGNVSGRWLHADDLTIDVN